MNKEQFLRKLISATSTTEASSTYREFMAGAGKSFDVLPVGNRANNQGTIEVATDAGRSVIERITNAIDALLELEHHIHNGKPACRTPREAAEIWLGLDSRGLGSMTMKSRQDLARKTVVQIEKGEGKDSRIVTVRDSGIGLLPAEMPGTILSLNEGNKWQKHYLSGTFGQGGSSTFAFSKLVLIASRRHGSNTVGFTVVTYKELPAEKYKSGHYVYLTEDGLPLELQDTELLKPHGTIARHFGYDLTSYANAYGERSLYGAMNRVLFDPVAPIWFENKVEGWNRGIYGSRTRLNSASEDAEGGKKIELDHSMPLFSVNLGEYGFIGIEYWVLPSEKSNTPPTAAYVDHRKPIVLTINGQNQSEISAIVIRRDAGFPYLRNRLICHIDCNRLSVTAKRALFASTREQAKEGVVLERVRTELIEVLKSDDELKRLNREAKDKSLTEEDEEAKKRLRKEVAKMLNLVGKTQVEANKSSKEGNDSNGRRTGGGGGDRKVEPLETREPPTFIHFARSDNSPLTFYAGQRRWLRLETDASSEYHNPLNAKESKINFIIGPDLKLVGSSALKGGRMRIAIECYPEAKVKASGDLQVELYRTGLQPIRDEWRYEVVSTPPPKPKNRTATFPDFLPVPVDGPEDQRWPQISESDSDITRHASNAVMDDGILYIYYSLQFPKFAEEFSRFAAQDLRKADSFKHRYTVWLAVHALLMHEQQQEREQVDIGEEAHEEYLRQERCRIAVVAAMVASQEVRKGDLLSSDDE